MSLNKDEPKKSSPKKPIDRTIAYAEDEISEIWRMYHSECSD